MREELYLVFGCFGRRENEFVYCPSVSNRILKIDESLVYYDDIMDYFEAVRLFDKPMFDTNTIRHFVYNMQDRFDQKVKRLWKEVEYERFERFMIGHKACGLYIRLVVVTSQEDDSHKEKPTKDNFFIKGDEVIPVHELKLVHSRGRRS